MINHPNRRRATKDKPTSRPAPRNHEHDYSALLIGVRESFSAAVSKSAKLFLTDAEGLNDLYLSSLPSHRQVHNCHSCRRFIHFFGGLVTVTDGGDTVPVMWNTNAVPAFYRAAFTALSARVKKARIVSPFLSKYATWGTPLTGQWSHMAVVPPSTFVYRERTLTAGQAMAARKENYLTVITALREFTPQMLDEALRILNAGALARSDKFVSPVKWLRVLHDRPKGRKGENVLWRAIAEAPEGYCHPRASVIAPLLEDIASGLPFEEIKARFDAKMAPLRYQRPQVAPSAGNIKAAEAIADKFGIGPSLERRFARLDEICTVWVPKELPEAKANGGIFGHLTPKNSRVIPPVDLPAVLMTWERFAGVVLPNADELELYVPHIGRFIALTTATNADAPPILKWDVEVERNPVAWYVYPNGSPARQWGLDAGTWAKVTALAPFPNLWGSRSMSFIDNGIIAVLDGAIDTNDNSGNALFPECLKDELHAIRATIEAYSRAAILAGREAASACGYDIRKSSADCVLRAFSAGTWTNYRIDRWE